MLFGELLIAVVINSNLQQAVLSYVLENRLMAVRFVLVLSCFYMKCVVVAGVVGCCCCCCLTL